MTNFANHFVTDLQSVEIDESCGRRYWLSHLEAGHGIEAKSQVVPRLMDEATHADLRELSIMEDISAPTIQTIIDDILEHLSAEERQDVEKMELLYRRLGWFAAFALFMEPELRTNYEPVPVSPVLMLDRDPLWTLISPDRLLKSLASGETVYREYVPFGCGVSQRKWLQSWEHNIRLHLSITAINDGDVEVTYGQVMGLNKGFNSLIDNRLVHPYVWGYRNIETKAWSTTRRGDAEWELVPVWTYPDGLVAWVKLCGEEVAKGQFPLSPPVYLDKELVTSWSSRRLHREREINSIKAVAKDNVYLQSIHFPKITGNCCPADAPDCSFLARCWSNDTSRNVEYILNPSTT